MTKSNPSHVTYYVALPFILTEEGHAPGQAEECRTQVQAACARKRCREEKNTSALSRLAAAAILQPAIFQMQR